MQDLRPSCRVFIAELLKSDFYFKEGEDLFIITPTCAICGKFFGIAKIEVRGRRNDLFKLDIMDYTASIEGYTRKSLPEAGILAFLGKLQVYNKNVTILVEEVRIAGEIERDIYTISTARRTLERIERMYRLLKVKEEGWHGGKSEWIKKAFEHYSINEERLEGIRNKVIEVVKDIEERYSRRVEEMVIEELKRGKREIEMEELKRILRGKGIRGEWVEEIIGEIIEEGRCYEPEVGKIKIVE
ncbi:MAG: hypothetical protein ACXQTS_05440 [Candidatus Methanospirareceae archaeon]